MEYRLSKFKNDIANQFGHNVFYNNVLIRVFYYLLEKRINTRILFFMTTYRRVLTVKQIWLMGDFVPRPLIKFQYSSKLLFSQFQIWILRQCGREHAFEPCFERSCLFKMFAPNICTNIF